MGLCYLRLKHIEMSSTNRHCAQFVDVASAVVSFDVIR